MILSKREKKIIYFILGTELDKNLTDKEWYEIDTLRDKFKGV